jgi:hypothetical protein
MRHSNHPRRRFLFALLPGAALLILAACNGTPTPPVSGQQAQDEIVQHPLFVDVTANSGVQFTYHNGEWENPDLDKLKELDHYAIIQSLGGGGAVADFFGTGRMDLFLCAGGSFDRSHHEFMKDKSKPPGIHGRPWKLYKNLGNFKFQDVTHEVGLDQLAEGKEFFFSHGAAVCDYDRDGWPDLLITGWHRMALFHNEPDGKGGRRFVEVTKRAGLPEGLWTTSAAWADLDGDGYPDLYVCQYVDWSFEGNHPIDCTYDGKSRDVCPPKKFTAIPHHVFRNNGDGTFSDVSLEAGLRMPRTPEQYAAFEARIRKMLAAADPNLEGKKLAQKVDLWMKRLKLADEQKEYGKGLGVMAADVNGDGKPDIYVANDTVDNFLYMNRSTPGQILLEELGLESGTARDLKGSPNGSMGLACADFNHTGRPSIWVTNYEAELHALYQNDCKDGLEFFLFATEMTGIAAIGQAYVGWGTHFIDLYHTGWEDIFITNGHAIRHPTGRAKRAQKPVLLHNLGKNEAGRIRFKEITNHGGPYFQDVHQGRGAVFADFDNDGRIDIALVHLCQPVTILRNDADTDGNHWLGVELCGKNHADVVGAKITLETEEGTQSRFAIGGGSYASSSDRRHVFGIGKATKVGKLTVTWPNGQKQSWDGLAIDRYWRLAQDEKEAQAPPKP